MRQLSLGKTRIIYESLVIQKLVWSNDAQFRIHNTLVTALDKSVCNACKRFYIGIPSIEAWCVSS